MCLYAAVQGAAQTVVDDVVRHKRRRHYCSKEGRRKGRGEAALGETRRPEQHYAAAAPRLQPTTRAAFSAGPAALVVSLLAIVPVWDKVTSFRARPRRCRRKEKGTPTHVQGAAKGRAQGGTVSSDKLRLARQWYFLPSSRPFASISRRWWTKPSPPSPAAPTGHRRRGGIEATHKAQCPQAAAHLAFDGALRTLLRFPGLDEVSEYGFVLT